MDSFGKRARFLFRSEQGVVDAPTWRRHSAWLAALILVLTGLWLVLRPYAHHDLKTSAFLAPMTIVAFLYLIVYAFAVILIAISYTMLSIKRLRDRGEPTGMAGLVPLFALFAGALHFLQAQTPDAISRWYVTGLDGLLIVVVLGTIADLGFRGSKD